MMRTDYYDGRTFDYRTEYDAGRWSEDFPPPAVVLGVEEPERLKELVKEFSPKPFRAALNLFKDATYTSQEWRTKEKLLKDPALVIIENPWNGTLNDDEKPVYWSGYPNTNLTINEELLEKIWYSELWDPFYAEVLATVLRLTRGEYLPESGFYSLADESAKMSKSTWEDIQKNPENYALVFSDYHF